MINLIKIISLALLVVFLSSCSLTNTIYQQASYGCNYHTFINNEEEISGSIQRSAILPVIIPRNFYSPLESLGNSLANSIHQKLLSQIETGVLELIDWNERPDTRKDFFEGNFNEMHLAWLNYYDYIYLSFLEQSDYKNNFTLFIKKIDINTGETVWYGKINVAQNTSIFTKFKNLFIKEIPSLASETRSISEIYDQLAQCTADALTNSVVIP
jgi:hypothetical protein